MRPTDCDQCKEEFLSRPMLMAKIRHLAAIFGESVAQTEADDQLAPYHEEHQDANHV